MIEQRGAEQRGIAGNPDLATLSHTVVPLVRAWNRGKGSGGVQVSVDATLAVLHRAGLLVNNQTPELILRTDAGSALTCDWGHCRNPAVVLRWSEEHGEYLAVCAECAVEPDDQVDGGDQG